MTAELFLHSDAILSEKQATFVIETIQKLINNVIDQYNELNSGHLNADQFIETLEVINQYFLFLSLFNTIFSPELMQVYVQFYQSNQEMLVVSKVLGADYPRIFATLRKVQNSLKSLMFYQYFNLGLVSDQ